MFFVVTWYIARKTESKQRLRQIRIGRDIVSESWGIHQQARVVYKPPQSGRVLQQPGCLERCCPDGLMEASQATQKFRFNLIFENERFHAIPMQGGRAIILPC